MRRRGFNWIAPFLALAAVALPANGAITEYAVFKTYIYTQVAQVPNLQPFNFAGYSGYARILYNNSSDFTAARVTSTSPLSPIVLSPSGSGVVDYFAPNVTSKQTLDADFPNNTAYTFSISGGSLGTVSATLSTPASDGYSSTVPVFSNSTFNALQGVDPTSSIPLAWSAWSAPSVINNPLTFVTISRASDGVTVFSTQGSNNLTSATIAPNTLQPGTAYIATLTFSARLTTNAAGFGGAQSNASYDIVTLLDFTTGGSGTESCTYALAANSATVGAAASTGSVQVTTQAGCAFTASAPAGSFASITNGPSFTGTSTVNYSVQANGGNSRSTTLTIAGQSFTINQLNGCLFGLTPSSAQFPASGGTATFTVGASSGSCAFTAASNNTNFLIVNGSGLGVGPTAVSYTVAPNSSSIGRAGTITAAGQTFTVTQAGTACSFSLGQAAQSFSSQGGTGTVTVAAPAGCTYSAQSNSPFVTITGGANGSGNGTVSYSVQANAGATQRTATLTIAAQTYAVIEAGAGALTCTASAASAPQVALEGRTELLGDLLVTCTGLTSPVTADVSLSLNTNVTNTLVSGTSDATLLVNGASASNGAVTGYGTLHWPAVVLSPSGGGATLRITNIRVDASLLGSSANLQSVPVTGLVAINTTAPVPVANASQTLAFAGPTVVFQKAAPVNNGDGSMTLSVQFSEASIGAFHAGGSAPTRLRVVLTGVPAAVGVSSPVFPVEGVGMAQMFTADATGAGGTPVPGQAGSYQVTNTASGTGTATWVVMSANASQFDTYTFPLILQNANAQNLSQIQISASLGPVSQVSSASATAPIPRFRDFSVPQSLVALRSLTSFTSGGSSSLEALSAHAKAGTGLSPRVVGSNGTFTDQVTNDNQSTMATGVTVGSNVTGDGTVTGCTSSLGSCTVSGNEVTANIGNLNPMQSATITVSVAAGACGSVVCPLQNNVSASADQPDADLSASRAASVQLVQSGSGGGTPAQIAASGGTGQSATVGTAFASPLQVTVTDSGGSPVSGVTVTFAAPTSGASATLSSSSATTNSAGIASVTATANATPGSYTVTATAGALSTSFALTNTSQGTGSKVASESSQLAGTPPAGAAIDGNTDGNFFDGSVTATNNTDANPWWQVDLGSSQSITSVVVWNRTDCCGSRLTNYYVFVLNSPIGANDTPQTLAARAVFASSRQTAPPNPSTTIQTGGVQGRYVGIMLDHPDYLSLAEVQVMGSGSSGAVATESSQFPGSPPASAAFDGNTDGNFAHNSVTATNNTDANPWWQVDLGSATAISSVTVWNRTDCCGSRLTNYYVLILNSPIGAGDTPQTLAARAVFASSRQTAAPNPSTTIQTGGAQGRYVAVMLDHPDYLSLAEVQVQTGSSVTNIAKGRSASQSSTLPTTPAAGVAVDGSTDGNFFDGSVTATTNVEANPWWQVDLGSAAPISSVVVWNRTDCCGSRLSNYFVYILNSPVVPGDTTQSLAARAVFASPLQSSPPNPSTTIQTGGAQGQYVAVMLNHPDYLSLAEVQVFAPASSVPPAPVASESSQLPGTPAASAAFDGNTDGNFFDGSVTATNADPNAWWEVDLGATQTINSVTVWNRTDCCGSRLGDFYVFVSNTPFQASDTPASLLNAGTPGNHQTSAPNPSVTIPFGVQGRYVRVQLTGTNYLSLAEVQIR